MKGSKLVMCILAGLPRDFDTIVAVLEISEHKAELDTVPSKLLQAEQRLGREEKPDNRAFFTSRSSNQKHRTGTSSTGSSIKECWYCGRRGHLKADCLKRKSDEQQGRRNFPRGPSPSTGPSGHRSVAAMGVSAVNWDHDWVLDSGASNHITGNCDLLTNIRETDHNISVTFANGTVSEAKYMGDALLDTDTAIILLRDVLYIPAAAANLFSVTTATRRDTKFQFGLTGCTIHHQGRDIGVAKRGLNGLYYIPSLRHEAAAYPRAEAVNTASYIRCCSPTAKRLRTPWELYNQKPEHQESEHEESEHKESEHEEPEPQESEHEEPEPQESEHEETEHQEPESQEPEHQELPEELPNSEPSASQPPTGIRRSARTPRQASEWWKQPSAAAASSSGNNGSKHGTASAMSATLLEPATYEEAMASEEAEQWQQAMDEESASLMANGTWTLEELPPGLQAIAVKWVFKVKTAANGTVERFKARLVAKGYRQQEGIDYVEVFAPVSKYAMLRTLLAAVAANNI